MGAMDDIKNNDTSFNYGFDQQPWRLVQLSTSTIAAGLFLSLSLWALCDMRFVQRRKTIFLQNNGNFLVLFTVFTVIAMLEIVEFFLVYDFVFFKSMVDWSNEQKNNGAHRLSSSNDLHEMQSAGISLDNSIFSVQLEEDDDGIDEGNPRQPLA